MRYHGKQNAPESGGTDARPWEGAGEGGPRGKKRQRRFAAQGGAKAGPRTPSDVALIYGFRPVISSIGQPQLA